VVVGAPAVSAERGDEDEAPDASARRLLQDVARAADVDALEGHFGRRLADDARDVDDRVALRGRARERSGVGHVGGERLDAARPLARVPFRAARQKSYLVPLGQKRRDDAFADDARPARQQNSHQISSLPSTNTVKAQTLRTAARAESEGRPSASSLQGLCGEFFRTVCQKCASRRRGSFSVDSRGAPRIQSAGLCYRHL
jgi:hypothetical protein